MPIGAPGRSSSLISASTRTMLSVPTTRRGSAMLTAVVAHPVNSTSDRTNGQIRFTGRPPCGRSNVPCRHHYAPSEASAARTGAAILDFARRRGHELDGHGVEEDRVVRLEPLVEQLVGEAAFR